MSPSDRRPRRPLLRRRDGDDLDRWLRGVTHAADLGAAVRAVLAVLDLHAMWTSGMPSPDPMSAATCRTCHVPFPCPTRGVIARELDHQPGPGGKRVTP